MATGYEFPEDRVQTSVLEESARTIRDMEWKNADMVHLARKYYPEEMVVLETVETCVHCRRQFRGMNNYGRWQCRYHPGRLGEDRQTWACCGASVNPRHPRFESAQVKGCLLCDHRATHMSWTDTDTRRLPEPIERLFRARPDAVWRRRRRDDLYHSYVEVYRAQSLDDRPTNVEEYE